MKSGAFKTLRNAGVAAGAVAALACAAPTAAFAEESGGITAILPDMNEFIPMLVAFLIVLAILVKFGWPIFDGIVTRRETTIKNALEKSEEARIESERVLAEYRENLAQAKQEAIAVIAEAKQSGEAARAEITAKAQEQADDIVAKARQQIEAEKKAAIADLQASVADLTVAAMAKVIGEDFTDEDHRKLIEASVAKAGKFDA